MERGDSAIANYRSVLRGFRAGLFLGSAVGMVRFPDFYTRMHAAGKGDTLSTMLMLLGSGWSRCKIFQLEVGCS